MTPKEKANELVSTFLDKLYTNGSLSFKRILHPKAIECAIIAVNEILNINSVDKDYDLSNYWNEVLTELNNL